MPLFKTYRDQAIEVLRANSLARMTMTTRHFHERSEEYMEEMLLRQKTPDRAHCVQGRVRGRSLDALKPRTHSLSVEIAYGFRRCW